MATLVDNRLNGPDGTTPTPASLAASGSTGTVGIVAASGAGPATYDDAHTVHGLNTIRVETGHHRQGTAHLTFDLPPAPWFLRFYVQLPPTQDAGEGWEEGIWVARVGDYGLVLHETAGGNIGFRLQPAGLAQEPIEGELGGTALAVDQLLRVELSSNGTDTACGVYVGHDTSVVRSCMWSGVAPTGTTAALSAYRYTRNRWLATGDNDPNEQWTGSGYSSGDTPVTDLQNALMDLGYELPQWGADGWYGQELIDAVNAFQTDYGYAIVDGEAGPETLAGIRHATWIEVDGTGRPSPMWMSHLAVSDSGWVGPAPEQVDITTSASATITATGVAVTEAVEGPTAVATDAVMVTGHAVASKSVTIPAVATITAPAAAQTSKHGTTSAEALVTTSAAALLEEFRVPVDWPPDITVEMLLDGQWVDITRDVYVREDIQITRGRQDEAAAADPGTVSLLLNNRHGKYSPRNPYSPYYGRIGRNTPLRVRVAALPVPRAARIVDSFDRTETDGWGEADSGQEWTLFAGSATSFSVNGGLGMIEVDDVGIENLQGTRIVHDSVPADVDITYTLQTQSYVPDGDLAGGLFISTFVTHEEGAYQCNVSLRTDTGSVGGLGRVIASINIHDGAPLTDLIIAEGVTYTPGVPLRVRMQAVERQLRLRAWTDGEPEPDVWHTQAAGPLPVVGGALGIAAFATQEVTLSGPLQVEIGDLVVREYTPTNHAIRMTGEVSAWPPRWDTSGNDVWVPIEASGILRRLGQGATPLRSALRRTLTAEQPLAYWPLEDGPDTRLATSLVDQVEPLRVSGLEFGKDSDLVPSVPLPRAGARARLVSGDIPSRIHDMWTVVMMYRLADDDTPEEGEEATMLEWTTAGEAARWRVTVRRTSSSLSVWIYAYDDDGVLLMDQGVSQVDTVDPPFTGQWNYLRVSAAQDGSDTTWRLHWIAFGNSQGIERSFSATVGRVTGIDTRIGPELEGLSLGHITVWGGIQPTGYFTTRAELDGAQAGQRAVRLAAGTQVPLVLEGTGATPLGQQGVATLLELLDEAGEADLGVLGEQRETLGLRYRGRDTLYDQDPVLVLDYANGEITPPLEPTDDDQDTRNDVTAKRSDGGEVRVVDENGPMGVEAIGRYDESVTVNVESDSQLPDQAGWRLHLGTVDEARYPVITLNLSNPRMRPLLEQVIAITEGDRIRIENLPDWLPPGPADLIVQGYTETLNVYTWAVELTCTPASPWTVAHVPPKITVAESFEDETYDVTIADGGDEPWRRTAAQAHDGLWSLRSGDITHGQTSDVIVTVPTGSQTLSVWCRVSSEEGFDQFRILLDGVEETAVSGEIPWSRFTTDVSDTAEVTFRYTKDGSVSEGEDRAWIDNIVFTLAEEVVEPDEPDRADTAGSELAAAIGETTTTFDVATTAGPVWVTDVGELPFDIRVGGEVMRVTEVSGESSPQTFTVTRSINSITKSHGVGSDVRLAQPAITAL